MTPEQWATLTELRASGYAVVVFNPQELDGADPRHVSDRLVEAGWYVITALKDGS